MHRSTVTVLLCTLCLAALGAVNFHFSIISLQSPPSNDPKRIYLIHADELRYDRWSNNDAQVPASTVTVPISSSLPIPSKPGDMCVWYRATRSRSPAIKGITMVISR